MSRAFQVQMDHGGCDTFLKCVEVQEDLGSRAKRICDRATELLGPDWDNMRNPPFMSDVAVRETRAVAYTYASNPHGMLAVARDDILVRSLDAGR